MSKEIKPLLKTIGDYFKLEKKTKFVIPEYQRAYSWDTDNCDKLWQDVIDFEEQSSGDAHFFGTIIINCKNDDEGNEDAEYRLIDGQQRTTTFMLLLKALLINVNLAINSIVEDEDSEKLYIGLRTRRRKLLELLYKAEEDEIEDRYNPEKDKELYKNSICTINRSMNELYKDELRVILENTDFDEIAENITVFKGRQKDNRYTNYFRNFKFFYYKAQELSESRLNSFVKTLLEKCEIIEIKSWYVDQAIEMFNTLNSDGMPLCDADIISAQMYGIADNKNKGSEFLEKWEELHLLTEKLDKKGIIGIDSILTQTMYYYRTINGDTQRENGNVDVTTPGVKRYYTNINKDLINNPFDTSEGFLNLANMWDVVKKYPIAKVLFKFNDNSKHFLASYFYRFKVEEIEEDDEYRIKRIFECMLRLFALLEIVEAGYSSKFFKTFLFKEEIKLANKEIDEDEIIQDFNNHINGNWDKEEIINSIGDCERNNLVYLNDYLFAKEQGLEFDLFDQCDVEHIMPSSGRNKSAIRKDAGMKNMDEFAAMVNKLGNKILLESEINRGIGNEWFRSKVSQDIDNNGYNKSKYPIASALVDKYENDDKPYWTKDDINKATKKASQRIADFIFGE